MVNSVFTQLVKIATRLPTINTATLQSLLHDWTQESELVEMAYEVSILLEPSLPLLAIHGTSPLEEQLQKQELQYRQLVRVFSNLGRESSYSMKKLDSCSKN